MNIVVCIKQVPATSEVKLNQETNTLIREGIESIINPFDTYAIEEALRLRQKLGGRVTALSMGIPSVVTLLLETLSLGVDQAVLLSDRKFAGADTLATAYALACGVRKIGAFDLIICGKQATDGDTAQVGPSLAEQLGLPHVTYVRAILQVTANTILCSRLTDDGDETVELTLPAVITVVKEINVPRLPSIASLRKAQAASVTIWSAADVMADSSRIGILGSPTQVLRTFVPIHTTAGELITGTATEQARELVERLVAKGLYHGNQRASEVCHDVY